MYKDINKLKENFYRIIPRYAVIPLLIALVLAAIAYAGSATIIDLFNLPTHKVAISIDEMIPFMPQWIVVYFGCYVSWVVFYIIVCRESKKNCYTFVTAIVISKIICMVVFIAYPTEMFDLNTSFNNGIFDWLVKLAYSVDKPYCLFPSVHCLESWITFRALVWCKKVSSPLKVFAFILAILVFLSTVFVKQHYVLDIVGGVLVAEIGIFISKRLKLGNAICRKVCHEA